MTENQDLVVLVKLGALGDIIQASYSALALRQSGRRVVVLTDVCYAGLFPDPSLFEYAVPHEFIVETSSDKLKNDTGTLRHDLRDAIGGLRSRAPEVRLEWFVHVMKCRTIVDLDGFPGSMLITRAMRDLTGATSFGWRSRSEDATLQMFNEATQNIYVRTREFADDKPKHGIERYRSLLESIGLLAARDLLPPRPIFDVPPDFSKGGNWRLALHLVGSRAEKNWSVSKFADLVVRLLQHVKRPCEILLVGNSVPGEQAVTKLFSSQLGHGYTIRDCPGMHVSAVAQASALRSADIFIGVDSAWGHMAAALGVKTFTIFGDEADPATYRPWPNLVDAFVVPASRSATADSIDVTLVLNKIFSLKSHFALP